MAESARRDALERAVPPIEAPADLLSRLDHAVRVHRRRRRGAAAGSAALAAAVVATLIVAPGLGRHGETGPGTAVTTAPVTTAPVTSAPLTSAPLTSAPLTDAPPTSALLASACDKVQPNQDRSPLPASFGATAAVVCGFDVRRFPGHGTWTVTVTSQLNGDLRPLMVDLTRDYSAQTPTACTDNDIEAPQLVLVSTAGRLTQPKIPFDECGHPQEAVRQALSVLKSGTIKVAKVKQVKTEAQDVDDAAAAAAGCPAVWKEPFNFPLPNRRSAGGPFSWWPAQPVLCLYQDDPIDTRYGDFSSGRKLSTTDGLALQAAIDKPGVRLGCASHSPQFAAVIGADGSSATIELGTCWRVVRKEAPQTTVSAADKAALQHLIGAGSG